MLKLLEVFQLDLELLQALEFGELLDVQVEIDVGVPIGFPEDRARGGVRAAQDANAAEAGADCDSVGARAGPAGGMERAKRAAARLDRELEVALESIAGATRDAVDPHVELSREIWREDEGDVPRPGTDLDVARSLARGHGHGDVTGSGGHFDRSTGCAHLHLAAARARHQAANDSFDVDVAPSGLGAYGAAGRANVDVAAPGGDLGSTRKVRKGDVAAAGPELEHLGGGGLGTRGCAVDADVAASGLSSEVAGVVGDADVATAGGCLTVELGVGYHDVSSPGPETRLTRQALQVNVPSSGTTGEA